MEITKYYQYRFLIRDQPKQPQMGEDQKAIFDMNDTFCLIHMFNY